MDKRVAVGTGVDPSYRMTFTSNSLKMRDHSSSIRLLESSSGTFTTELLRLTSSGVRDEESLVVLEEKILEFKLILLVLIFLIVGKETLGDSLSHSHDLSHGTGSSDTALDGEVFKPVSSDHKDGFKDLGPHGLGLNKMDWLTIDSDEAMSIRDTCDGGSILFSTESSNLLLLNLFTHV